MPSKNLIRRFSSSVSDLLHLQRRDVDDLEEKNTPLHNAVKIGNKVMVSSFIESESFWIDEKDAQGQTALHYSVENNEIDITSILLKGGANADVTDFNGVSPCHIACKQGFIDNFNLLFYFHVDVCSIDKYGKTPFDLACEYGKVKMIGRLLTCGLKVEIFQNSGANHTASCLHLAAANGHVEILAILLDHGWNINKMNPNGSALHVASNNGRLQCVRFLLKNNVDASIVNGKGQTALASFKRNTSKNPITQQEIGFLLKNSKNFVEAVAVEEYCGTKVDELIFNIGDNIWVTDRSNDQRWKGIIFGQKGNSQSGFFRPSAVKLVEPSMNGMQNANKMPYVNGKTFDSQHNPTSTFAQKNKYLSGSKSMSSFGKKDHQYGPPTHSENDTYSNGRNLESRMSSCSGSRLMSQSMAPRTSFSTFGNRNEFFERSEYAKSQQPQVNGASVFPSTTCHYEGSRMNSQYSLSPSYLPSTPQDGSKNSRNSTKTEDCSTSSISSPSSLASSSLQVFEDSIHFPSSSSNINVTEMVLNGVPSAEIIANWLDNIGMNQYLSKFLTQGYDIFSISRCSPSDLVSLGISNPEHRKKLISDIQKWNFRDNWPIELPNGTVREFLHLITLAEYANVFENQGYYLINDILDLTWEDLEDIGVKRLGHLKRFELAVKKLKENKVNQSARNPKSNCNSSANSMLNLSCVIPTNEQNNAYYRNNEPPSPSRMSVSSYQQTLNSNRNEKPKPLPPKRVYSQPNRSTLSEDDLNSVFKEEPLISLKLHSNGKILSDISKINDMKHENYASHNMYCPPPPAPLACSRAGFSSFLKPDDDDFMQKRWSADAKRNVRKTNSYGNHESFLSDDLSSEQKVVDAFDELEKLIDELDQARINNEKKKKNSLN